MYRPLISFSYSRRLSALIAAATVLAGTFATYGDWKLVWSDEFNGTSIDNNHWKFETGNHNGWGNHELEYYTDRPDNACVSNGVLHIVARQESTNGFAYTSARIKGQGLFSKKYGRLEFLAQVPEGKGSCPALRLIPHAPPYRPQPPPP